MKSILYSKSDIDITITKAEIVFEKTYFGGPDISNCISFIGSAHKQGQSLYTNNNNNQQQTTTYHTKRIIFTNLLGTRETVTNRTGRTCVVSNTIYCPFSGETWLS